MPQLYKATLPPSKNFLRPWYPIFLWRSWKAYHNALGIILDAEHMEARLSPDKLSHILYQLLTWLLRKKATKPYISLVSLLQHACKVVKPGRSLVSRTYAIATKMRHLTLHTWLNRDFKSDQYWC